MDQQQQHNENNNNKIGNRNLNTSSADVSSDGGTVDSITQANNSYLDDQQTPDESKRDKSKDPADNDKSVRANHPSDEPTLADRYDTDRASGDIFSPVSDNTGMGNDDDNNS